MLSILTIVALALVAVVLPPGQAWAGTKRVSVEAPGPCHRLERVDGGTIRLAKDQEPCAFPTAKIPVVVDEETTVLDVFVEGKFWRKQPAHTWDLGDVARMREKADNLARPNLPVDPAAKKAGEDAAAEVKRYMESEEYKRGVDQAKQEIAGTLAKDALAAYYPDAKKGESKNRGTKPPGVSDSERLYLFISSSMPKETIRAYLADIDRLGGGSVTVVMRGFIGGMKQAMPTLRYLAGLITKDQSCDYWSGACDVFKTEAIIDPILFRRYRVESVPALVYAAGVQVKDREASEGLADNARSGLVLDVRGDAAMGYLLRTLHEQGGSANLKAMADYLEGIR